MKVVALMSQYVPPITDFLAPPENQPPDRAAVRLSASGSCTLTAVQICGIIRGSLVLSLALVAIINGICSPCARSGPWSAAPSAQSGDGTCWTYLNRVITCCRGRWTSVQRKQVNSYHQRTKEGV
jgi:hypothetical protein